MTGLLAAINIFARQATPCVLVTVAAIEGSAPREPGAKMLVTSVTQVDTIGGGRLEMRACEIAREMLSADAAQPASERRMARFALGPGLGQCCGGVVYLVFERIDQDAYGCLDALGQCWRDKEDCWRLVPLDTALPVSLAGRDGSRIAGPGQPAPMHFDRERPCHLMKDDGGKHWLVDPWRAYRPHLALFGAGHVGAALVRALADLPCHVTWVDERDDIFPATVPANVKTEATDTPEAVVDEAAPGSSFLVMTHSHALDQRLAEAILRRDDAGWFGLIGSQTKRMLFERRLRERGIGAQRLAEMICPIGIPGIRGKSPAVIAASVCAQLLQVWDVKE